MKTFYFLNNDNNINRIIILWINISCNLLIIKRNNSSRHDILSHNIHIFYNHCSLFCIYTNNLSNMSILSITTRCSTIYHNCSWSSYLSHRISSCCCIDIPVFCISTERSFLDSTTLILTGKNRRSRSSHIPSTMPCIKSI